MTSNTKTTMLTCAECGQQFPSSKDHAKVFDFMKRAVKAYHLKCYEDEMDRKVTK